MRYVNAEMLFFSVAGSGNMVNASFPDWASSFTEYKPFKFFLQLQHFFSKHLMSVRACKACRPTGIAFRILLFVKVFAKKRCHIF